MPTEGEGVEPRAEPIDPGTVGAGTDASPAAGDPVPTAADADASDGAPAGPRPYDFRRPHGMPIDARRLLEVAFEEVRGAVESWLSAKLREPLKVAVDSIDEVRFGGFRESLPRPCNAFLFSIPGEPDHAVMHLDHELAFTMIERTLGSQVDPVHVPERPLTWIERTIMRDLVEQAGQIMVRAWDEQVPVEMTLSGFEAVPEMIPGSSQEATLLARLRVGGTGWVSTLTQVLPAPAVTRALTRRSADRPKLDPLIEAENRRRITSRLQGASMPISVRLPRFDVSLRDVSTLDVGAVIVSDLPADTGVEVFVSDQIRFLGRVGRQERHLAVEVLESTAPCPHERDSE